MAELSRQLPAIHKHHGRPVLQQRVPQHAAAEAGDEPDDQEAEEVEVHRPGERTAEQRRREHPGEVEHVRDRCQAIDGQQVHENHQTPRRTTGEPSRG